MDGTQKKKILIIRMSSLGDIVLTAPVLRNIKEAMPDAEIDFLVKPQFAGAVKGNKLISKVIPFSGLFATANAINAAGYDYIIDLHAVLRSRLVCALSKAKKVIRYKKSSLARRLFVKMKIPSPSLEKHTAEKYLDTLKEIDIPIKYAGPELGDWDFATAELAQKPKKLLLLQTAFLGDCVLTLPLLKKMREVFPEAQITVITRPETVQVFSAAGLPGVTFIEDRKKTAKIKLAETLRIVSELTKQSFDAAIIPHRSFRSAFIAWKAGIPLRIGFSNSAGKFFLTHKVPFSWLMHDVERNLSLLSPLAKDLQPSFPGIKQNKEASAAISEAKGLIAGINPGSAWPTKRWPAENWADLIKKLYRATGKKVLISGGPGEKEWNGSIERAAGPDFCLNLTGKTSMPELMEAIRGLKVFISNDSGPMHIACALGVPAVGIFGPTTKELGFFPYGKKNTVVQVPLACRPCALHGSKKCPRGHFLCMKLITPKMVFDAAAEKLDKEDFIQGR
ncbi:MAG: lipopolysaccharide heptosyltransferase II [Elusimicrobiales bacterium]|nr:lipopolysaccharide heptosyltransferase II [Elusimicrobiales bacterium]